MKQRNRDSDRSFNPILSTKLHQQETTTDLVKRDRLIKRMDRALEVPLTLISAPAGYGKSVLAAQWAGQTDTPIAWLSLDADDSDLRTFFEYFLAAVESVKPDTFKLSRKLQGAASPLPVPVLASYLLNDLDSIDTPCAIVLDDYHRIAALSPVQELILCMLKHPPREFHFIVLTRHDPPIDLSNLRASNRINDIRLQDLCFSATETGEFLNVAQDYNFNAAAVKTLDRKVEGWAAGLRLMVMALRHVDEPDIFFNKMQGNLPQIQEYLLREVLVAQNAEVRNCLLASSILDRFCEELLDNICVSSGHKECPEYSASAFLEELQRNNLFIIPLDSGRKWFRYHHLFRDLLFDELRHTHDQDFISALHLRASQWYEIEELLDESLTHALAAGDMTRAVVLVARNRHAALDAEQWHTLEIWLSHLPEEVIQQHAELLIVRVWIAVNYHFRIESVLPLLDNIESMLGDEPGVEQLRGEAAAIRGYIYWLMGNGAESLHHIGMALEWIPESHVDFRSNAELIFSMASQMMGLQEQGTRFLDDLLMHPGTMQDMRKSRLLAGRVFILLTAGNLTEAEVANRRMWRVVERTGSVYVRAWTSYLQGLIHLQRCEWSAAAELLEQAVEQRFLHHARAALDSMAGLILAYQALGREGEARIVLQTLNEYVAALDDPAMESVAISIEARLALLQGGLETARRCLEMTESQPEGALVWWLEIPSITRCRTMIDLGSPGDVVKAEAKLRKFAGIAEAQHNIYQLIRIKPLLAMACEMQGKAEEALDILERVVTMAWKGDHLLPFVELGTPMVDLLDKLSTDNEFVTRVKRLVNTFGSTSPGLTSGKVGAVSPKLPNLAGEHMVAKRNHKELTNRELDILDLLTQRLRNKEIAARLNISHHTVDSHLKQIYRKLGVHGRRKAVEEAIRSDILKPGPAE